MQKKCKQTEPRVARASSLSRALEHSAHAAHSIRNMDWEGSHLRMTAKGRTKRLINWPCKWVDSQVSGASFPECYKISLRSRLGKAQRARYARYSLDSKGSSSCPVLSDKHGHARRQTVLSLVWTSSTRASDSTKTAVIHFRLSKSPDVAIHVP